MKTYLTIQELDDLIAAYISTHTRIKSVTAGRTTVPALRDAGLIQPKDPDVIGERTTAAGDRVVEAALAAAGAALRELDIETPLPPGATHVSEAYGTTSYYRRREVPNLNQLSEEWQKLTWWDCWHNGQWEWVGTGFCDRHLKEIGK